MLGSEEVGIEHPRLDEGEPVGRVYLGDPVHPVLDMAAGQYPS